MACEVLSPKTSEMTPFTQEDEKTHKAGKPICRDFITGRGPGLSRVDKCDKCSHLNLELEKKTTLRQNFKKIHADFHYSPSFFVSCLSENKDALFTSTPRDEPGRKQLGHIGKNILGKVECSFLGTANGEPI